MSGERRRPPAWRQVLALVRKDALLELRSKDLLASALTLGLTCLGLIAFCVDFLILRFDQVGPAVLWIAVLFTAITALSRTFALEREDGCLEALLLAPMGRTVLFIGKLVFNTLALNLLGALVLGGGVLFLNQGPGRVVFDGERLGWLALVLVVHVTGLAVLGTLLGLMTLRSRRGELLLPLLQGVLSLPILILAVIETRFLFASVWSAERLGELLKLSLAFDVLFLTAAVLLFPAVAEE
ncbi:MAG: heme exporter protein CcmB [Acidobacteriota bacterium]